MKTIRFLFATALFVALAAPAFGTECRLIRGAETPEDPADDVEVCPQEVWFHGPKAGNLAAAGQAELPTWDTTKPATPTTSGGGSAYAGNSLTEIVMEPYGKESGPVFVGQFTGNIDNLAVEMFLSAPWTLDNAEYPVRTRLEIDGVEIYADAEGSDVPAPAVGTTTRKIRFAFRDIHDLLELEGVAGADKTHTVKLSVLPFYFVTDAVFLYDASDVPSGMVFNARSLQGYTVLNPPA